MPTVMDDRRRGVRLACQRDISVDMGLARFEARALDFSWGGVLLASERALAPGSTIRLELVADRRHLPASAWAEVRWCVPTEGAFLVGCQLYDSTQYPMDDLVRSLLVEQELPGRRSDYRFRTRLPARFGLGGASRTGMVMDLSAGGLRLLTTPPLAVGQKLRLSISAPGDLSRILLACEVLSVDANLHSLRITSLSAGDLRLLSFYLLELLRKARPVQRLAASIAPSPR